MAVCASTTGVNLTQDEIIEMADKAGFFVKDKEAYSPSNQEDHELTPYLEAFAKLVAEKEREKCAEIAKWHREMAHEIRRRGQT
jgi:DNA-binding transcriptional regulator YhcF (GntR family)